MNIKIVFLSELNVQVPKSSYNETKCEKLSPSNPVAPRIAPPKSSQTKPPTAPTAVNRTGTKAGSTKKSDNNLIDFGEEKSAAKKDDWDDAWDLLNK